MHQLLKHLPVEGFTALQSKFGVLWQESMHQQVHVLWHCVLERRALTERSCRSPAVRKARCCRTNLCAICFATVRLILLEVNVTFEVAKSPAQQ